MQNNFPTDKFQNKLVGEYETIFAPLKNEKLRILEVGIFKGGSLLWLADYFPNAEIVGIDLGLATIKHERIKMLVCDQNDSEGLNQIGKAVGKFNIIIDDGSHKFKETDNTFKNLFQYLENGGLYIIEDFMAGYFPNQFPEQKDINLLIFQIAEKKIELGISDFNIIFKEPSCSLAVFKKK